MTSVDQVAVVVRDLDEAMRRYSETLGIGPWRVYTFAPDWIRDMTFRGRAQAYSMRLDAAIGDMEARAFAVLQRGWGNAVDGDGGYADFETDVALGCILEAIERPRAMPDPDRIHPS